MNLAEYLKEVSWKNILINEFSKQYFIELDKFIEKEYLSKKIFPQKENIFTAFNKTPFDKVKVVIIGQDPYHGRGQAHGLSFSVPDGVKPPPSLVNIFKEIENDLGIKMPEGGNLENWAKQ